MALWAAGREEGTDADGYKDRFTKASRSQIRSHHLVAPGLDRSRSGRRIRRLAGEGLEPRQVERLQAPAGSKLSFAVLGDGRSNPEVFGRVLRQLDRDPGLAFAIEVGDMVERGTLEQFDAFFKQIRVSRPSAVPHRGWATTTWERTRT